MRVFLLSSFLILHYLGANAQFTPKKVDMVTFRGILSGEYHDYLAENKEYQERSARYEQLSRQYYSAKKLIKSLELAIKQPHITPYFRERTAHIAKLVKNKETGDVYKQVRVYGIDFALVLNDIIPIVRLYECERIIVSAGIELKELESWAKSMAAVSEYFKHLFLEGKLNQPLSYYTKVQSYDKQIDQAYRNFIKDGNTLKEKGAPQYKIIFTNWQSHLEELRLGKDRKGFFQILEKKYGNSIDK